MKNLEVTFRHMEIAVEKAAKQLRKARDKRTDLHGRRDRLADLDASS